MESRKGFKNLAVSIIYKILVFGIGLVLPRLFILSYGSEINGLQSSVSQIFVYIALIEAGIGEASLQALFKPISKKDYNDANAILSATTKLYNRIGFIYFGLLLVVGSIYTILVPVVGLPWWNVLLYIIVSGATTGFNFFFMAKVSLIISVTGDGYISTYISFAVYILTSIIKIICILLGLNIVIIQLSFLMVNLGSTFIYYLFAKKRYPWLNFKQTPNYEAINQSKSVFGHKISGIIFHNTDVLILTFFCDLKLVSVYTMYKLIFSNIDSLLATFGGSFNFIFGQTMFEDKERYCKLIDYYEIAYSTIATAIYLVTYALINPFLGIYTRGADIDYVYKWLPLLFYSMSILNSGREAMLRTITVSGHFKTTLSRSWIESVINLISSIILVQFVGIYGTLLGTVIALLYRSIDIIIYANHKILNRSCKYNFSIWIVNIASSIIGMLILYKINIAFTNYVGFIVWGLILLPCIFALCIIPQMLVHKQQAKGLLGIISTKLKKLRKNKKENIEDSIKND